MQKTLRSLIHEKLPLELRFQLELLSRKRNLINDEKFQKIIELFREFNVGDVVQLGPGTNRYAVKIDGYVLKIATDNDGKIDNLKEFKMAKRLYPYVTKTYEVSENGTLLVAEYISPFSSYHEMCMYADQIREILSKLSSTYLIGDVGITAKNYANWGLRAGSSEPVCLDFAYVYEVSSELFICRKCNTNSMLVPDRDFKHLNCSNPHCGKEYSFEDIRAKIGNDIHRHEIGDLKEEGYYLTSSNVITELSEQRSNYLCKKKPKKTKDTHQEILETVEEEISMKNNIENNMAIAEEITSTDKMKFPVFKATAVAVEDGNDYPVFKATAVPIDDSDDNIENESSDLAFSGSIEDTCNPNNTTSELPESGPDIIQMPSNEESTEESVEIDEDIDTNPVIEATAVPTELEPSVFEPIVEVTSNGEPKSQVVEKVEEKSNPDINERFISNMQRAFSKISNRIGTYLDIISHYDIISKELDDEMTSESYYKNVQNAVFRSLVSFCNFSVSSEPNYNGKGSHRVFLPPTEIFGMPYEPTMIFIARVWNNRDVNSAEDPDMMKKYRSIYNDYDGIQREWIDVFKSRLAEKMKISDANIDKIVTAIESEWCSTSVLEPQTPVEIIKEDDPVDLIITGSDDNNSTEVIDVIDDTDAMSSDESDEEEVAFSGTTGIDVIQNPNGDDDDDDEGTDDSDDEPEYLSVEIYHEDDCDIVRINTEEFFGPVSIPFYANLDKINIDEIRPSIVDDRNGVWDWLIHIVPDLMFTTKDPDKWLNVNNVEADINQPHIIIMDNSNNVYTMGVYFIKGIFEIDDDGNMNANFEPELLAKINRLFIEDIGYSRISHLRRSLKTENLIHSENEIIVLLSNAPYEDYPEGYEDDDDDEEYEYTDVETAAVDAILSGDDSSDDVYDGDELFDDDIEEFTDIERDRSYERNGEKDKEKEQEYEREVQPNNTMIFKPIHRNRDLDRDFDISR